MVKKSKTINYQEDTLYNNILSLSRNKLFFTKFDLTDTFQNRIYLIFIHISFLFTKLKHNNQKITYAVSDAALIALFGMNWQIEGGKDE